VTSPRRTGPGQQLGAAHTVNAATTDPVAAIEALGGADVAVILAAGPKVLEQAHASLCRGGRLVLLSLPEDNGRPNGPAGHRPRSEVWD
jgi:D-arabinose 1-dehydrogenase-like Zn-dependent alcohol dehydrogenase